MPNKSVMQQYLDWLKTEWESNEDFKLCLYIKLENKAKELLKIEEENSKNSSHDSFVHSEIQSRMSNFFNGRYPE